MSITSRLLVQIRAGQNPEELPSFAKKFIELGYQLYQSSQAGTNRFVTLVTPIREYVSALISLGALYGALETADLTQEELEPGSKVRVWDYQGGVAIGDFENYELKESGNQGFQKYAIIQLQDSQSIHVPTTTFPIERVSRDAIGTTRDSGHKLPSWFSVAKNIYGFEDFVQRFISIREISAIIGSESTIREELSKLEFYSSLDKSSILPKDLLFTSNLRFFKNRTVVLSAKQNQIPPAQVVILDGNTAVDYHKHCENEVSGVAILEPYRSNFARVLAGLQQELVFKRVDNEWLNPTMIPEAVEASCHLQ